MAASKNQRSSVWLTLKLEAGARVCMIHRTNPEKPGDVARIQDL
ncbi:MAG: hypothetical protein ACD_34C00654G0003 [uncultured bacterium]|nr:MAG: hypothetical protein ACD_34C00654G0003 [uncultured bacterium]